MRGKTDRDLHPWSTSFPPDDFTEREGLVAKRSKRAARAASGREEAAFSFLAAGALVGVLPLFFRGTPLGNGLSLTIPLGLVALTIGGLLLFLSRVPAQGRASGAARVPDVPTLNTVLVAPEDAPAVGQAIEDFERASQEARTARGAPSARPTSWGPDLFNLIEWRRFEAVVEALFRQVGFDTKSRSHGADGGVDVWLFSRQHPEVPVGLVQCKHWSSRHISVERIRELLGVMAAKKVGRGVFATTTTFTSDAAQFARENGIDLLDINRLLALIAKRTPEHQQALLEVALEGDYWRPTCASCGNKMVERAPRQGGNAFWGCSNFPACRKILSMRH
ncbi:MAG TPA: restriction endonuclease [Burkholderiaceae bacterium]|nr:restriction endonuclease [Burkholderiaceae bacterium]